MPNNATLSAYVRTSARLVFALVIPLVAKAMLEADKCVASALASVNCLYGAQRAGIDIIHLLGSVTVRPRQRLRRYLRVCPAHR